MKTPLQKKHLVGTWSLKHFLVERPGKGLIPWAKKTKGLLIYTKDGTMSVAINSFDSKKDSLNHILFYSGQYSVKANLVSHYVQNASALARIGQTMLRDGTLRGKTLTLTSLPPSTRAVLVWKRLN